eukprot:1140344-Pelagomonas_calceolata.AAC.7
MFTHACRAPSSVVASVYLDHADARLVSTSRTKMGRPKHVAKDLTNREQKAVIGSKGQYELDGEWPCLLLLGPPSDAVQQPSNFCATHQKHGLAEQEQLFSPLQQDPGYSRILLLVVPQAAQWRLLPVLLLPFAGDIEAELQAELGELVERVQSIHYSGRLAELDVDELLEVSIA